MGHGKVSVIIPAYNEARVIGKDLQSIKNQSYKDIEIIVVDDSSTDDTVRIAKKFTKKVYEREHAERSVQRNFGAGRARGEYFLFLDADMELTKNVVKECIESVQEKGIGAIVIPERSVATNFWESVKAYERSFYLEDGYEDIEAARFFPRKVFNSVGGYDEKITGPEDWDLPERIKKQGFKVGRINSFIYHHERVRSPFQVAKKKYYYALKSYKYISKHNIPTFGPKTVYFLRPVFYIKWKRLVSNPLLTMGMIIMLSLELIYGGFGYFQGKILKR